ncbi:methyltransferase domain-containing protein [Helicobacter saguini]|uniref:Methyltransferase domain-containing protein n=2 Tax=Helicobacter saguini TaxID=1548018 RepID=A0A347VTX2_9HELI|nr:methyltransferase domain-containing protein [Helicobacter saguini]MWV67963.1 methyltransferase domain-containing protein [Helicobacter saguini]MWV70570.1 methyltransferase domain-containing protein [Helicobacter saguini]MWV72473.1 methyltransferase domain-containing protein [Helicobacter saguini]TLD94836.1 methyltransferase domain-containing protein [Helicobacter saguini]
MRSELIKILKQNLTQKSFKNVFEFGTHCGEYTQLLRQNIESKNYIANDICDYNLRLKGVKTTIFDMNELQNSEIFSQKFDLITSNATLQWLNFDKTLQNLVQILSKNGVILCSSFGEQNLIEIKKTTGYGLQYESLQTIESKLKKYFKNVILSEQFHTLKFKNALEIFRHLKLSGVNSCGINSQDSLLKQDFKKTQNLDSKNAQNYAKKASKQIIIKKSWLENLEKNFDNKLTYHCIFFLATT